MRTFKIYSLRNFPIYNTILYHPVHDIPRICLKTESLWSSLIASWLEFQAFIAMAQVQWQVGELRSHEPCGVAKKNPLKQKTENLCLLAIVTLHPHLCQPPICSVFTSSAFLDFTCKWNHTVFVSDLLHKEQGFLFMAEWHSVCVRVTFFPVHPLVDSRVVSVSWPL